MTDTMIERVARAIYTGRNGAGCKPWAHQPLSHRDAYLKDACAAIAAMREPSEAMMNAPEDYSHPHSAYQAMIDAALNEAK